MNVEYLIGWNIFGVETKKKKKKMEKRETEAINKMETGEHEFVYILNFSGIVMERPDSIYCFDFNRKSELYFIWWKLQN